MLYRPSQHTKHTQYHNKTSCTTHLVTEHRLRWYSTQRAICSEKVEVELCRILVTWWKDLSPGFNSSIQTGTLCSLGDGSETRQIHQRLSGYFLNIGARTETLMKVKPNLM